MHDQRSLCRLYDKPSTQRPCLLIVEDEAIVAMDMAQQLDDLGFRVCGIADNSREALALAQRHQPDLVLMDVVIKGPRDGIETATLMVAEQHTPVLFLTAFNDASTVQRAVMAAPYGYLTKPFQIRELLAAIEVALYKASLEQRLKASERWFSSTLRCVADGVVALDTEQRIRFLNPAAERTLGRSAQDLHGLAANDVLTWAPADEPVTRPVEQLPVPGAASDTPRITFGRTLLTKDGRRLAVDESVAPILDDRGAVIGTVCALRDVSARVLAEQALRRSEERFRTAFDFAPMGMALVAMDGSFLQGNAAMHALLHCTEQQLLALRQQDVSLPEEAGEELERLHELRASNSPFVQFEKRFRAVDGQVFWAQVSVSLLKTDDAALCYLYQVHDLSARKAAEQALLQLAHADALTGLYNRPRLTEELQGWVSAARRHGRRFAVLFMDLDLFKQANDQHGHAVGDEVLRCTAHRLRQGLRASDKVGRWGGDEFVALVADLPDAGHAVSVVRKLSAVFETPMQIDGHHIPIGLSMGVALYPDDGSDADVLLRHADAALYRAKARGRGQAQFYSGEVCEQLQLRRAQGEALAQALAADQLQMLYQPVRSLRGGSTRWLQASAHWTDGAGEGWGPAALQCLANERGLGAELAAWQLRRACQDAAAWADPQLAVAVPMAHCAWRSDSWGGTVAQALADSGLAPQRLGLDIEAAALSQDRPARLSRLLRLAELGVGLSLRLGCADALRPDWLQRLKPVWLKLAPAPITAEAAAQGDVADGHEQPHSLAQAWPALAGLAKGLGAQLLLADHDAQALAAWREAGGEWVCSPLMGTDPSTSPPG